MKRAGFSLIEMLVATTISAILMAAVLAIIAGVSRDRKHLTAVENQPDTQTIIDRLQWDLTNARTISQSADGTWLQLTGNDSIDHKTLAPNGRLVRVDYHVYQLDNEPCLVREQKYLDDPASPNPWRELLAVGVSSVRLIATSPTQAATDSPTPTSGLIFAGDLRPRGAMFHVPDRLRIEITAGSHESGRDLWLR